MNKQPTDSHSEDKISLKEDLALAGEDPDVFYEEEMRNQHRDSDIQKLSHRMTLLFILIPCLLVAVFAFVYMDVRERLIQMESTGSEKVDALSQDVVEKVTSLSQKFETLEKSFGEKLSILKDASVSIQDNLKQNQRLTKSLANAKMDKATFEIADKARMTELADIKATFKAELVRQQATIEELSKRLQKELDQEANAVTAFQSDLREQGDRLKKISNMIESLQRKSLKLELDIKLLSEQTVTKQSLEQTNQRTADLEKKAKDLAEDILWLENTLKLKREKRTNSKVENAQMKRKKPEESVSESTPNSEGIIEQEIKE